MIDEIYNYRLNTIEVPLSSDEWKRLCKEFEDTLTEEQRTMFRDLCDMQSSSAADEIRAAYKAGFKDGGSIIVETLDSLIKDR